MTATAASRGWGTPDHLHGKIVPIHPAGITLEVNEHVAPLFETALNEVALVGKYDLKRVADDWGYSKRYIRGLEAQHVWSNHAWGLAVDINATNNPMTEDGRVHTDMPPVVIAIMSKYGFFWGGHYSGKRKDPMHFEFLGTPAEAEQRVSVLRLHPAMPDPSLLEDDMAPLAIRRGSSGPLYAVRPGTHAGTNSTAMMLGSIQQLERLQNAGLMRPGNHVELPEAEFDDYFGKPDNIK